MVREVALLKRGISMTQSHGSKPTQQESGHLWN